LTPTTVQQIVMEHLANGRPLRSRLDKRTRRQLMAPHMARRLVGPAHEGSQPAAALIGGLIVLVSDFIGRTLFAPVEVPAGIIIALVGAPFFIYLLARYRGTL